MTAWSAASGTNAGLRDVLSSATNSASAILGGLHSQYVGFSSIGTPDGLRRRTVGPRGLSGYRQLGLPLPVVFLQIKALLAEGLSVLNGYIDEGLCFRRRR